MKASEQKSRLTGAGLTDDEATRIVKAKVDDGSIEDDLGFGTNAGQDGGGQPSSLPDPAAMSKALDQVRDSLAKSQPGAAQPTAQPQAGSQPAGQPATGEGHQHTSRSFYKGGGAADSHIQGLREVNERLAKAQDALFSRVDDQHQAVASGLLALGQQVEQLAKGVSERVDELSQLRERVDHLNKALGQPMPPKSVQTAEQAEAVTQQEPASQGGEPQVTYGGLQKAIQAELEKGPSTDRATHLNDAAAMLDSGEDPYTVADAFNIEMKQ